ncbi:hypothetical protein K435DRAFT_786679 [Dendrothele bispora CBS 962.96]|uniref:Uncharacterized protein n=1 Tax=Dendrothele bispora (strain CBS 962.96) TaxID=1314807 RepID=A0A4V4HB13_DENBC|nr:hypothetical protein K435DRAFT_786679 [Dendrothele bispora CBS 962.96]
MESTADPRTKTARRTPLPERLKPPTVKNNINGTMPSGRDRNATDIKVDIDLKGTTSHSDRNSHRRQWHTETNAVRKRS